MKAAPSATATPPPCNLEVEAAVLAQMMASPASLDLGLARLRARDFFKEHHRRIFDHLTALRAAGQAADVLTVTNALAAADELEEVGGRAAIIGLAELASTHGQLEAYIAIVLELSTKRQLLALGMDLVRDARNGCPTSALIALVTDRLDGVTRSASHGRFRMPLTLAQLAAAPPRQPAWLVDGLILEAANGWLGAGAKVGKSYLALDLLLACCLGAPWLGHFAVARPLTVALVQEEDSAWRVYHRASCLCAGRGVAMPDTFHVLIRSGLQLDEPASLDPFLRWLATARVDLLVWDVFNRLHTKNEKQPDQMLPILRRVDRIRDELGVANLIAHHGRKPSPSGPDLASGGQKLRGPSEFHGWAENSLYLAALKGKGVVVVEPESKDAIIEPFKVHLEDLPDGARRWIYDGVVQARDAQGAKTRQALIEALTLRPEQTAAQLAQAVSLSEKQAKRHLKTLREDGVVTYDTAPDRTHTRLWSLADAREPAQDAIPF